MFHLMDKNVASLYAHAYGVSLEAADLLNKTGELD